MKFLVRLDCDEDRLLKQPNTEGRLPAHCDAFEQFGGLLLHLWELARKGNLQRVRAVLEMKLFEVNEQMPHSRDTALHLAVKHNHFRLVEFLLEAGADPSLQNEAGHTPLDLAKDRQTALLIRVLLEKRGQAESEALTDRSMRPSHCSAQGTIESSEFKKLKLR